MRSEGGSLALILIGSYVTNAFVAPWAKDETDRIPGIGPFPMGAR